MGEENIKEEEEVGSMMKLYTTKLEKTPYKHTQADELSKAEKKIDLNTADEFVYGDEIEIHEHTVGKKLKKNGMKKKKLGRPKKRTDIETVSSDKKVTCNQCSKVFSCSGNLYTHMKHVHSPPTPCQHCGLNFRYIEHHIKKVHTTMAPTRSFICDECGKSFKTKNDVAGHKKYHLPNDIKEALKTKKREVNRCSTCGKGFTDKTKLKRHEAARHNGIRSRSFHCQQCTMSYYRADHLKSHVASSHGINKFKLEYNPVLLSANITDIDEIF